MATVQISARIDGALKNAIDEYCKSRGIVLNHFIQEALISKNWKTSRSSGRSATSHPSIV